MKKLLAMLLAVVMVLSMAACAGDSDTESTPATTDGVKVMTYAEYAAAEDDAPVVVECYVQATQSWWQDQIVVYAQDADGAYFAYKMACSEEDAAKLVPGTKIRITGFKTSYKGLPEIAEGATFEFVEGADTYIAEAKDVTSLLADDALIDYVCQFVSFTGMTVEAIKDGDGNEHAFLYNWDGSGEDGSDLYFNVSVNGATYNFCVESYLCDKDSDVYAAVKALEIGDVIDMEGFLYWYDGVNPHITSVTPAE